MTPILSFNTHYSKTNPKKYQPIGSYLSSVFPAKMFQLEIIQRHKRKTFMTKSFEYVIRNWIIQVQKANKMQQEKKRGDREGERERESSKSKQFCLGSDNC